MANGDLRAEIAALESELSTIKAENQRLRSEIGTAVGAINGARNSLNDTTNQIRHTLSASDGSLQRSHQRVVDAYEIQKDMDKLYARLKQMELANKRIRECNNTKYYDFAVYRTVRKIVQGIMDNLDFSMVTEEVIEKAVERKQLEEPDYWLTCTLMAVVAWRADQRERAQRALERAMQLDDRRTASFLLVFYLRLRREDVALKWFAYLTAKPLSGSEKPMVLLFFSMLSKTVEDKLSDATRTKVNNYIRSLVNEAITDSGNLRDSAIDEIAERYGTFVNDRSFPYDQIAALVPTYGGLQQALALARNNANVIDFINAVMNVDDDTRNEFLKAYIDKIVADPCAVEQKVYDEIERNEMIIRLQGDVDAANEAYQLHKQHDAAEFDIVHEMMAWLFTPGGNGEANAQMRRNMLLMTRELQQEAGDRYIANYQRMFQPVQAVKIDDFEAGQVDLSQPQGVFGQVEEFYHGKASAEKAQIKDIVPIVLMVLGVAGGVAAAFVSPALIAVGAIVAVGGLGMLLLNMNKRKRIDLAYEQRIASVKERLTALGEQFAKLAEDFHEQDLLSAKLCDTLNAL